MGIDIYAQCEGQQAQPWLSVQDGDHGYLREAYHGEPYATKFLCAEAFPEGGARIKAAILRKRLPQTLTIVEQRWRKLYRFSDQIIEAEKNNFRNFVRLCERMESQTGKPVLIVASY